MALVPPRLNELRFSDPSLLSCLLIDEDFLYLSIVLLKLDSFILTRLVRINLPKKFLMLLLLWLGEVLFCGGTELCFFEFLLRVFEQVERYLSFFSVC